MENEFVKILTASGLGGAAVAIIVVKIFMADRAAEREDRKQLVKDFRDSVREMTEGTAANQRAHEAQVQALIDDHMKVTREAVMAIKALEVGFRELKEDLRKPPPPAPGGRP